MIGFALNGCGSSCIAGIMGGFLTIYLTDNCCFPWASSPP